MNALQAALTINTMSERQITEGFERFTHKVENFFDDKPHVVEIAEFMEEYVGIALPSFVDNDNISLSYSGQMFAKIKKYLKTFANRLFVEIRNAWVLE